MCCVYTFYCLRSAWPMIVLYFFFFFKQNTAYEMRISDWSSDVCSSDLPPRAGPPRGADIPGAADPGGSSLSSCLRLAKNAGIGQNRGPTDRGPSERDTMNHLIVMRHGQSQWNL